MSPIDEKKYIPFILLLTSFGIYFSTLSPVVYLGDSGELTAAAFSLGIPHGSGYPLYTLLGKLFCLIPIGNIGFRMNLMSAFFGMVTVWLVYSMIMKMTSSMVAAFVGAFFLAFTPLLWWQTVAAEVYTLHTFFVVLLIRLLWRWDERREFTALLLFVFMTGISFGNHMQTVMLAPAVLFIVLSADKKTLFSTKNFIGLSVIFVVALSIYLYLPIRTGAGAAIHWGDPDNLDRFLAHVTGRTHRHAYVFNKTPLDYLHRTKDALWVVGSQFGLVLLLALWGWLKLGYVRWRIFFVLVIFFDFVYTIFLNFISLEITPFTLPTSIVLGILAGFGVAQALKACERFQGIGSGAQKLIKGACCLIPVIPLFLNYGLSDQSRNYTAYEHVLNIFRTTGHRDTLIVDGDNNFFPVIYGRIVARMREDVILFDRQDIQYKMPYLGDTRGLFYGSWKKLRPIFEKHIIEKMAPHGIYFAVFDPDATFMPAGYALVPNGMLYRVVKKEELANGYKVTNMWKYYSSDSYYDHFERDYLTRQVGAHFYLRQGQFLFMAGRPTQGINSIRKASRIGYNDTGIHSAISNFLADQGQFEEAREELEKSLLYHMDKSLASNNWGAYFYKMGAYDKAIKSFREAIQKNPTNNIYFKNLAHALYKSGREKEAALAFKESLALHADQPEIIEFIKKHGLRQIIEE